MPWAGGGTSAKNQSAKNQEQQQCHQHHRSRHRPDLHPHSGQAAEREWAARQPKDAIQRACTPGRAGPLARDTGLARRLLAARPDLRDKQDWIGDTPLMKAAMYGRLEIARLLVDGGAPLDIRAGAGCTALWKAAACNRPAVVRLLVDRGADQTLEGDGKTPRGIADLKGHTRCAALLR